MPLVRVKTKGQITIPKKVRDTLGLIEGDLLEIEVENGKGVFTPQRVVAAAPAIKLTAKEQRALIRAKKKIKAIQKDLASSKGLTREEIDVAAKTGMIDPDQRYWWTEEWQEGEREVERNYAEGRFEEFDHADDFLKSLPL